MDELQAAGVPVHTVGKIGQVFDGVGVDVQHKGATNAAALAATAELIDSLDGGFVFTNLVETDQVYGHRNDVPGYHGALKAIDAEVGRVARAPGPGARPAGHHRRPRLRPDDARHRPHARARAAARALRRATADAATTVRSRTSARRSCTGSPAATRRFPARRSLTHKFCVRAVMTSALTGTHSSCPHWLPSPAGPRWPPRRAVMPPVATPRAARPRPRRRRPPRPSRSRAEKRRRRHRAARRRCCRRRAAALEHGDAATSWRTSTGSQVAKDKRAIAAAKALPLGSVDAEAEGTEVDGRPRDAARRHGLLVRRHRHVLLQGPRA